MSVTKDRVGRSARRRQDLRGRFLDLLCEHSLLTQKEIERHGGFSRTTVWKLVKDLGEAGLVIKTEGPSIVAASGAGRPPRLITLEPSVGAVVGIQFEERRVRAAVADLALNVLDQSEHRMPVATNVKAALDTGAAMVTTLLAKLRIPHEHVIGAGMALPVPIDHQNDTVRVPRRPPNLWADLHPANEMWQRLGVPVAVENDANLAALAETVWGSAKGQKDVVYIKVSAGIGCGLILDGRLHRGAMGLAGELAHLVYDRRLDRRCFCGKLGCLSTVADAGAIIKAVKSHSPARFPGPDSSQDADPDASGEPILEQQLRDVINKANEGDLPSQGALQDVSRELGVAVASVCALLNPKLVILGGMFASVREDLVLQPLRESLKNNLSELLDPAPDIVLAALDEKAEVEGALALIVREPSARILTRLKGILQERLESVVF